MGSEGAISYNDAINMTVWERAKAFDYVLKVLEDRAREVKRFGGTKGLKY